MSVRNATLISSLREVGIPICLNAAERIEHLAVALAGIHDQKNKRLAEAHQETAEADVRALLLEGQISGLERQIRDQDRIIAGLKRDLVEARSGPISPSRRTGMDAR